ncbi:hypothetical protein ACOME3_002168 [Neoechinorhynchus agilis]
MSHNLTQLSKECNDLLNRQINLEFSAAYAYEQMALYCTRSDVALENFAHHFRKEADEEKTHARKFMDYLILRNGKFEAEPIPSPIKYEEFDGIVNLFEIAYKLEQDVYVFIKGNFCISRL